MAFNLSTLDTGIIIVYLIGVVLLGLYFSKQHQGAEDYFLAGRNLTWPIIGFSLFASNMSSNSLVGLAGAGFKDGFSVYNYEWMAVLILILFSVFFLPFYLKNKIFTIPEYLERRFSYPVRVYASAIAIILNVLVDISATLYAGGIVIQMIFPQFSLFAIIAVLAVVAGLYTIAGGLSSVMYTDTAQAILLIGGSIMITLYAAEAAGGWEAVYAVTPPSHFDILKPADDPVLPWPAVFTGVFLIGFYFWGTNQYITQRTLASRSIHHGQWGAMFAGLLKVGILFIMIFPGAFARVLYPELADNVDLIYPTMLFDLLPNGLLGLVLAGLLAAMMSSLDSGLNSVSTLFTMDFYHKFKPEADTRSLMRVGRYCTLVIMVLSIFWAPQIAHFEKLWDYLQNTLAWFCPPIVALFATGLFTHRATTRGAYAGIGVGLLITLTLILNQVFAWNLPLPHFLYTATIHFAACIAAILVASGGQVDQRQMTDLVWTKAAFAAAQNENRALPWWQHYQVQGALLLALVTIILIIY